MIGKQNNLKDFGRKKAKGPKHRIANNQLRSKVTNVRRRLTLV
jgi:hypothetical protein